MSEEEKDFEEVLESLEDQSVVIDEQHPPIFFSREKSSILDTVLHEVAAFRAQNTQGRQFFESEEEYKAHKQWMNDWEASKLMEARDVDPIAVDTWISHID